MLEVLLNPGNFVHLALLFYGAGFMVRDELLLRLLVLIGTGFYLLYYFLFPETPLWDAIFASTILGVINIVLIVIIIRERTLFAMNAEETGLFAAFTTLTPGQFRKMMKIATWHTTKEEKVLTTEGIQPQSLYYVVSGNLQAQKGENIFGLDPEKFIGEIGFLLKTPATATVVAPIGTTYIEWRTSDLNRLTQKSQAFDNALAALFNFDLAKKVTNAIGR
ncbi:MAG: cyclic nucleotide-binding domain-containing protein [Salaquimonas sp.]